jgi:hypothetical protein
MSMNQRKLILESIELASVFIVTFAMLAYGIGKLIQFGDTTVISSRISEMTGQELMWAFYGYSKPFQYVLGILEIGGGLGLLFRKSRLISGFVLSTVLVNVILQDVFYEVNSGALIAACIYQLLLFLIFWLNRERLKTIWQLLINVNSDTKIKKEKWLMFGLALGIAVVLRIVEYIVTH